MPGEIKPIETKYNGYKFRSRLEARWAVFFDAAGIRYEYEPEGFKSKKGICYLPDFYLPDENMYVEVKAPRKGVWRDLVKAIQFVGEQFPTLMILSNIPPDDYPVWTFPIVYYHPVNQRHEIRHLPFVYNQYGEEKVILDRDAVEIAKGIDLEVQIDDLEFGDEEWNEELIRKIMSPLAEPSGLMASYYYSGKFKDDVHIVRNALSKARQARFEFGEKG